MTQPTSELEQRPQIPWPVFFVTVAGAFVVALDLSIVNVAFPSIEASFPEVSTTALSWVLSAYSVVFGALLLGAGRIADRSGRRRWFLRGVAVFTLGLAALRRGHQPVAADRRPGGAGRRRRPPDAGLAGPAAGRHGPRAAGPGGGDVGRHLRPRRGHRPVARGRAHRRRWLALGVLHQPARPPRGGGGDQAGGHRVRRGRPTARPGRGGDAVAGRGVAGAGDHAGRRLGLDERRRARRLRVPPLSSASSAVRRARVHPAPAIDLRLFENRTVALANAATVAYAVGFFAMLLANVLFLTKVWDYSTLKAGLAITPGPLVVAALSRSTGALAGRVGYRPVLVVGSLVFATAQLWCVAFMPLDPDYLGRWLPASLLGRPRRGAHLPRAQRGGGGRPSRRPLRGRRRPEPDVPPDGRRAGRGPAGVDPRHTDLARPRPSTPSRARGSCAPWPPSWPR